NLFAGDKLSDVLLAENIVVFKRTQTKMLRPQGVTHNYHHRFELVIPLSKAGRIHVDDTAYLLGPGQAYLIFPHQFHHFLDLEEGEMNWLFITFECARARELSQLRNSPRSLGRTEREIILAAMKGYLRLAPGGERSSLLISIVSQLLGRLLVARETDCEINAADAGQDIRGAILQSINAYVRDNLDKPLTIAHLSKHTGYSVSHLRRVFREEFGASLGSYMRESRLSVAASMLSEPRAESVEAIARACGFGSIWAFSRAFKAAMGRSPRAYQQFLEKQATSIGGPRATLNESERSAKSRHR
ncbi:MAG: helix-turn-helix domain-containing protein, partial [bacterium]|nr:helix-turn-helix domain-containing protein [bacterium]